MLTPASRAHFDHVLGELQKAQVRTVVTPRLVRGLDYYTNTVFEIVSEGLGAQNAICGGGAYEGLVEELGGSRPTASASQSARIASSTFSPSRFAGRRSLPRASSPSSRSTMRASRTPSRSRATCEAPESRRSRDDATGPGPGPRWPSGRARRSRSPGRGRTRGGHRRSHDHGDPGAGRGAAGKPRPPSASTSAVRRHVRSSRTPVGSLRPATSVRGFCCRRGFEAPRSRWGVVPRPARQERRRAGGGQAGQRVRGARDAGPRALGVGRRGRRHGGRPRSRAGERRHGHGRGRGAGRARGDPARRRASASPSTAAPTRPRRPASSTGSSTCGGPSSSAT